MNKITSIIFKESRSMRKRNPRFGKRYYNKSHRYVYYMDGKPRYYFSERPYTIQDAKAWKKRSLFFSVLTAIIFLSFLITNDYGAFGPGKALVYILNLIIVGISIFRVIGFLIVDPEQDPMLRSFQCTSDFEKPREDACPNCGGRYSNGAHSVCPHCNAPI